jgi:glycogen(starch) synthase
VRILVLSDLFPPATRGGYEVECRDVVEHLRERHDVVVLTSVWGRERSPEDPGVLRRLPWTGDGSTRESITAALSSARATRITRRTLAEVAPDAIYVWNAGGVPATALRALQLHPAPMLVRVCEYWFGRVYSNDQFTRHLHATGRGARGVWDRAMRAAGRLPALRVDPWDSRPAAVCWNSEFVRERAPAPPAFEVVHGAIVIPSNARTLELADVPRDPVAGRVLFVGRLDAHKGAHTLVRALGALERDHGVRATLRVVGDGTAEERQALERLAAAAGVAERVTFTGPLRGEAFTAEITAASAWCVPSVWDEPAPLTCTEAALCRVPAVFSRVGGIPEMFAPDTQVLFHERDDAEGCAAALVRSLAGGPEVQARVDRAFARAQELSFGPYLEAMDRFLADGLAALAAHERPAGART